MPRTKDRAPLRKTKQSDRRHTPRRIRRKDDAECVRTTEDSSGDEADACTRRGATQTGGLRRCLAWAVILPVTAFILLANVSPGTLKAMFHGAAAQHAHAQDKPAAAPNIKPLHGGEHRRNPAPSISRSSAPEPADSHSAAFDHTAHSTPPAGDRQTAAAAADRGIEPPDELQGSPTKHSVLGQGRMGSHGSAATSSPAVASTTPSADARTASATSASSSSEDDFARLHPSPTKSAAPTHPEDAATAPGTRAPPLHTAPSTFTSPFSTSPAPSPGLPVRSPDGPPAIPAPEPPQRPAPTVPRPAYPPPEHPSSAPAPPPAASVAFIASVGGTPMEPLFIGTAPGKGSPLLDFYGGGDGRLYLNGQPFHVRGINWYVHARRAAAKSTIAFCTRIQLTASMSVSLSCTCQVRQ